MRVAGDGVRRSHTIAGRHLSRTRDFEWIADATAWQMESRQFDGTCNAISSQMLEEFPSILVTTAVLGDPASICCLPPVPLWWANVMESSQSIGGNGRGEFVFPTPKVQVRMDSRCRPSSSQRLPSTWPDGEPRPSWRCLPPRLPSAGILAIQVRGNWCHRTLPPLHATLPHNMGSRQLWGSASGYGPGIPHQPLGRRHGFRRLRRQIW